MKFSQKLLPKSFYSLVIDYHFTVIDYQWQVLFSKNFQLNLQRSNQFQNGVIDYNILVIDYQCV